MVLSCALKRLAATAKTEGVAAFFLSTTRVGIRAEVRYARAMMLSIIRGCPLVAYSVEKLRVELKFYPSDRTLLSAMGFRGDG